MLRVAAAVVAAAATLAAAGDDPVATRALEYLKTTTDETGLDVLVAVEAYGALTGDPRAGEVVDAMRSRVRPAEIERYGVLLGLAKPAFPTAPVERLTAASGTPDPAATLDDDRPRRCPIEMLSCTASDACLDFAGLDTWGTVLTHQAVWLLFANWRGCELPIDVEALRQRYGARLVAEARADPVPSDLFFERLALLGQLGFGAAIDRAWIESARASQQPRGCFPASASVRCHPHPTALALWALAHHAVPDGLER